MRITVLSSTSGGGWKVKLLAVMVEEGTGSMPYMQFSLYDYFFS
jgi:hypothetical protein